MSKTIKPTTTSDKPAKPRRRDPEAATARLGVILADASYPLPLFQKLAGLDKASIRAAKRGGLRVRQHGRRKYIVGSDWLAYLNRDPLAELGDFKTAEGP